MCTYKINKQAAWFMVILCCCRHKILKKNRIKLHDWLDVLITVISIYHSHVLKHTLIESSRIPSLSPLFVRSHSFSTNSYLSHFAFAVSSLPLLEFEKFTRSNFLTLFDCVCTQITEWEMSNIVHRTIRIRPVFVIWLPLIFVVVVAAFE